MGFDGDGGESAIAVVAVEIVAAEVIGDVDVGMARRRVAGGVAPGAGEAIAVIFGVEAGGFGAIGEDAVAFVVQQEVGRPVARVVVRHRVVILVEAEVIAVEAEVDVQTAITVVVGECGVGEGSLRGLRKLEGVGFSFEGAVALVEEEERAAAADDDEVLQAVVAKVGEEGAGGVVENADAGFFGDVFEGAIAAVAVEAIWAGRRAG